MTSAAKAATICWPSCAPAATSSPAVYLSALAPAIRFDEGEAALCAVREDDATLLGHVASKERAGLDSAGAGEPSAVAERARSSDVSVQPHEGEHAGTGFRGRRARTSVRVEALVIWGQAERGSRSSSMARAEDVIEVVGATGAEVAADGGGCELGADADRVVARHHPAHR